MKDAKNVPDVAEEVKDVTPAEESIETEVVEETAPVVKDEAVVTEESSACPNTEEASECEEYEVDEGTYFEVNEVQPDDDEPLTTKQFKDFKFGVIVGAVLIVACIVLLVCGFTQSVMNGMNIIAKEVAEIQKDVVEEPKKDIRSTSVSGELTSVRCYIENGEELYTIRIGGDYGVDVPRNIYEDLKDCVGRNITFNSYEESKNNILQIYFYYELEPLG